MKQFVLKLLNIDVILSPCYSDGYASIKVDYDNEDLIKNNVTQEQLEDEITKILKEIDDS